MIVKQCQFAGRDTNGEYIHLLQAGYDNYDLVKEASAVAAPPQLGIIQRFMKSLPKIDGKLYTLVSALGADEYWGSNSNADSFPEEPLLHTPPGWSELSYNQQVAVGKRWEWGYPTFYNAHAFAHHCFVAGTPVVMGDRTRRPIDEISVGDLVATRSGPREVTRVFSREYRGPGARLTVRGVDAPLVGTEDHPVLVLRRRQVHCRCRYNRLSATADKHQKRCREAREPIGEPQEVPLGDVEPGDYLLTPRPPHGEKSVEPAFAELLGWTGADGYIGKQGVLQYSFSASSPKFDLVHQCLVSNGLHVTVTPRPQYNMTMLTSCNKELAGRLSRYLCGVKSEKRLTAAALEWNRPGLLRLIGAFADGDGHVYSPGKQNQGQLRIRSSSAQMLFLLSDVIRSLGVSCTINWDSPSGPMISPTNGKFYWGGPSGCVSVGATNAATILEHSRRVRPVSVRQDRRVLPYKDMFLLRVTNNEPVVLDEVVHNLEVADVHEYIANEAVVHNCNKDPSRAFGSIEYAMWDALMRRVLLIVAFDRARAKRFGSSGVIDRVENGEYPSISMGCRVPFDLCRYCFDFSKYQHLMERPAQLVAMHKQKPIQGLSTETSDYCYHLKNELNKIYPDGRKVKMVNMHPRFFDLSAVFIGADKTSFVLAKLAGECPIQPGTKACGNCRHTDCVPSSHVAEVWSRPKATMEKTAMTLEEARASKGKLLKYAQGIEELEWEDPKTEARINDYLKRKRMQVGRIKTSALDKDAEIIKQVQSSFRRNLPRLQREEPDMPRSLQDMLSDRLSDGLSTAGSMGIVAKPREFQRMYIRAIGKPDLADELDDKKLMFRTGAPPADDFRLSSSIVPKILSALLPLMGSRSAMTPSLGRRTIIMIKFRPRPDVEEERGCAELDHPLMDKVSSSYSAYRRDLLYKSAGLIKQAVFAHPEIHHALHGDEILEGGLVKEGADVMESIIGMLTSTYLNEAYLDERVSEFVGSNCNLAGLEKAACLAILGGVA